MVHKHNTNSLWRQKWELMIDHKHTGEFFHTWHESEEIACAFVCNYIAKLGGTLPPNYYRPFNQPTLRPNDNHEPEATFIKAGIITLAPI